MKSIFPSERNILPYHSKPVSILTSFNNKSVSIFPDEENEEDPVGALFRVAKQVWFLEMYETQELVHSTSADLLLIESHPKVAKPRVAVTASGIMEVIPGSPIYLLLANFLERSALLPKKGLVAVGAGAPHCVFQMTDEKVD